MAFYVVLHHPDDRSPTRWSNEWERGSQDRIRTITTTAEIARDAQSARQVFVHRCGFGNDAPAIVSETRVAGALAIDPGKRGSDYLVTFETVRTMRAIPRVNPDRGTNSYVADAPE
jgi:hypothetical protein